MMGLAFLSIFTVLLRLAFETTQLRYRDTQGHWAFFNYAPLMAFEYFIDIFFFINFILSFRTAYFIRLPNGSHNIVTDPRLIALRFLRTWFILDLIGSVPWELIVNGAKMARGSNPFEEKPEPILSCARIPRILLLLRLRDVFALTNIEGMDRDILYVRRMLTIHSGLVRVVKLLVVLVLNIHIWACVVFYVGTLYDLDFHGESWLLNTRVGRGQAAAARGSLPRTEPFQRLFLRAQARARRRASGAHARLARPSSLRRSARTPRAASILAEPRRGASRPCPDTARGGPPFAKWRRER